MENDDSDDDPEVAHLNEGGKLYILIKDLAKANDKNGTKRIIKLRARYPKILPESERYGRPFRTRPIAKV
jgi:hypothetical protein